MRRLLLLVLFALLLAVPVLAQPNGKSPYTIELNNVEMLDHDPEGKDRVMVRVKFTVSLEGQNVNKVDGDYKLIIEENGKKVAERELPQPTALSELTLMLALDTSSSMKKHERMPIARQATRTFLDKLPKSVDCGLVLFDHEIRKTVAPTVEHARIMTEVQAIQPRGGTAYRDATFAAIKGLANTPKGRDRALVVMTDGADLNSTHSLGEVIAEAKRHKIAVYTIGIGEPGKREEMRTALVLDHSGSMELPADDADLATPKIKALHEAAAAFVNMMSSETGKVSLIPFSSQVESPRAFTNDRASLKKHISELTPSGETAVFDAVYTAIATLEANNEPGKRAVVLMTDGIDNSSRRRVDEVIEQAKRANIKLYLLGFGRDNEIDHATMKKMANETGGQYYHASNKDALKEIFEKLSIDLHEDGIDEVSLKKVAAETGGKYYPAKDVSNLQFVLAEVSKSIQREAYVIDFPSLNPRRDGTLRKVSLRLGRTGSTTPTEIVAVDNYQVHGLIIAEMHPFIYLVLLAILGGLIALPAALQRPAPRA